jgi:hypothetical protein
VRPAFRLSPDNGVDALLASLEEIIASPPFFGNRWIAG